MPLSDSGGIRATGEFRLISYSAVVVKEKAFEFDGVFTPIADDLTIPMVFAEAQMQTDENFYRRFFAEIFLYLEQYKVCRPWRGLLIFPSRGFNFGTELPYQVAQIRQLSLPQLEDLGEALLDFTDMGDLVAWLEQSIEPL